MTTRLEAGALDSPTMKTKAIESPTARMTPGSNWNW